MSAQNPQGQRADDGTPVDWGAAGDADAIRAKFGALPPEMQKKIVSWRPRKIGPYDTAAVEIVLPVVKSWVVAVQPPTSKTAAKLLWATTQMALWWHQQCGNLDPTKMLTLHEIQQFAVVVNADRNPDWQRRVRSHLRRVARTVNPEQWWHFEDGMNRADCAGLSPAVGAMIASWVPRSLCPKDAAAVEIVLPDVRSWVVAANPSITTADKMLWATTRIALWWHRQCGNLDPAEMLTLPNIQHFATVVNAHFSRSWQRDMRSYLQRVARTVNPEQWPHLENSVNLDELAALSPALSPEVATKIASWMPRSVGPEDAAAVEIVLPDVRSWVAAAQPGLPGVASHVLVSTTQMALWWYKRFGRLDAAEMLTPHNIEYFTMFENTHRSSGWRHGARSNLRRVGRAVNPNEWPLKYREEGFRDAVAPYSPQEEALFARLVMLPGRLNYAARIWVVVASFGAGLTGREASATRVDDLTERDDGRIVVTVRGPKARRVPIRRGYTEMAREAIKASDGTSFFRGTSPDAAAGITEHISDDLRNGGYGERLSFRRARNTWIVAHLTANANTRLDALRAVAGAISPKTLLSLIRHAQADITMDEAVEAALGA